MTEVHRDARSVWHALCTIGGIEIADRDEELPELLLSRLVVGDRPLEDVLGITSIDHLVSAFVDVVHPFVEMYRAILAFFECATAKEGRNQLNLLVDGVPFDLEHFRQFLRDYDITECLAEIPAVDFQGAWIPLDIIRSVLGDDIAGQLDRPFGILEVDAWLQCYREGTYAPFPRVIAETLTAKGLTDATMIALSATEITRRRTTSRSELIEEHSRRGYKTDQSDGLHPWTIAQNETDSWLRTMVCLLAHVMTASPAQQYAINAQLELAFAALPRRKVLVHVTLAQLESILSLPVWKKRHELYAVWIATEIVAALHGHECELHHKSGVIEFAFRETLVATIHTSDLDTKLISERRVPIESPRGKGRVANVQPDYGLWQSLPNGTETCGVVIEVKHYKKAAPRRFQDVLEDYAKAFQTAHIVLVNHGPMLNVTEKLSPLVQGRCTAIERLTANNTEARSKLARIVRAFVGEPVPRKAASVAFPTNAAFAIDVSLSMLQRFRQSAVTELLAAFPTSNLIALIDERLVDMVKIDELPQRLASLQGNGTNLSGPIHDLLTTSRHVIVITDDEGAKQLRGTELHRTPSGIIVLHIARSAHG